MAKSTLFYTIDEAAKKLGKTADSVRQMVSSGQLQEFKDSSGELVVKREQVDMLASDGDAIPLAMDDDREAISLADDSRSGSGSSAGIGGAKERSGISIFEGDEGDVDASAQTLITAAQGDATNMDAASAGSGSGMDMTRNDDTSLGGGLLDDVYSNDSGGSKGDVTAGLGDSRAGNDGLFENSGVASDVAMAGAPAALMVAEPYDGTWSGIAGGLALAIVLTSATVLSLTILGIMNAGGSMVELLAGNLWAFVGGFAGLAVVFGGIGMVLGRKS
jgi:hypothetical protein